VSLWKTRRTWITTALCLAAVAVPAQALAMPADTNGPTMRKLHDLQVQNSRIIPVDANDRAHFARPVVLVGTSETFTNVRADGSYYDPSLGRQVAGAGDTAVRPDDRAGIRGIDPGSTVIVSEPTEFDWSDAGIGALGMFAALGILVGAMLLAGYSQRRHKVAVL